jgi:hypothetical protein
MTARTRTTSLGAAFHLRTAEAVRRCRARSVGIRRQLPWGSGPSGVSTWAIVVLVCLSSTIRSQVFSPSQRFDPARALWLCFAPHPPLGFASAFRAFPSQPAVTPLGALCSLVVSACAGFARASSRSAFAPVGDYSSTASRFPAGFRIVCSCNPDNESRHHLHSFSPKRAEVERAA